LDEHSDKVWLLAIFVQNDKTYLVNVFFIKQLKYGRQKITDV